MLSVFIEQSMLFESRFIIKKYGIHIYLEMKTCFALKFECLNSQKYQEKAVSVYKAMEEKKIK